MGSRVSAALAPLKALVSSAQARADLGVSKSDTAQARADLGVTKADTAQAKADTAQAKADAALPLAGGSLTGALRSIRDFILERPDGDAVLRYNRNGVSFWSIRLTHPENRLSIFAYSAATKLIEFKFDGFAGEQALIAPLGDVSHEANLLSRKAGDDRYGRRYTSGENTIVQGGLLTLAHGLGATPKLVNFRLKCIAADAGYSVGDQILLGTNGGNSTNSRYATPRVTTANIFVRFSVDPWAFGAGHKDTGAAAGLSNSKWKVIVEASL